MNAVIRDIAIWGVRYHSRMNSHDPLRIAAWSGPRNISTALMRSWENRPDTVVCDEPFYAHYLRVTGLNHPGREEVIAHHETDWKIVVDGLCGDVEGEDALVELQFASDCICTSAKCCGVELDETQSKCGRCVVTMNPSAKICLTTSNGEPFKHRLRSVIATDRTPLLTRIDHGLFRAAFAANQQGLAGDLELFLPHPSNHDNFVAITRSVDRSLNSLAIFGHMPDIAQNH